MLGQHRSTQRKVPRGADDEEALTADIVALARQYGRYSYRWVTALLRDAGWTVNRRRVERIWRREGLKVPQKQPKRGRLWLNDGSCIRLRPEYPGHVWAYDFVEGRTHDGRKFRILTIIDEAILLRPSEKQRSGGSTTQQCRSIFIHAVASFAPSATCPLVDTCSPSALRGRPAPETTARQRPRIARCARCIAAHAGNRAP